MPGTTPANSIIDARGLAGTQLRSDSETKIGMRARSRAPQVNVLLLAAVSISQIARYTTRYFGSFDETQCYAAASLHVTVRVL